jgi:hypothetical protein
MALCKILSTAGACPQALARDKTISIPFKQVGNKRTQSICQVFVKDNLLSSMFGLVWSTVQIPDQI